MFVLFHHEEISPWRRSNPPYAESRSIPYTLTTGRPAQEAGIDRLEMLYPITYEGENAYAKLKGCDR